jgi:hypothetical protein
MNESSVLMDTLQNQSVFKLCLDIPSELLQRAFLFARFVHLPATRCLPPLPRVHLALTALIRRRAHRKRAVCECLFTPITRPKFQIDSNSPHTEIRVLWRALGNEFLEFRLEARVHVEEYDLDAGCAGDDDGEVIFDDGAHHGHGEAVSEVGFGGLGVDKVDARATCGEDEAAECEEEVHGDALRAADVELPGEDQRHGVQYDVCGEHEARVEVVEVVHVDAVTRYPVVFWICPHHADGSALTDRDKNTGHSKCKGDEVHEVDAEARVVVDRQGRVEE